MEFITTLFIGLGLVVAAQVIAPPAQGGRKPITVASPAQEQSRPATTSAAGQASSKPSTAVPPARAGSKPATAAVPIPRSPSPASASQRSSEKSSISSRPLPWYVILNSPRDINELWQKIENPDLLVIKPGEDGAVAGQNTHPTVRGDQAPPLSAVQSIDVQGRVAAEYADLKAMITIALPGPEAVWVPIRLDDQRVASAREENRELLLRTGDRREWQVQLAGPGTHQIQVEFRAVVRSDPTKRWLSVPVPEAASTQLKLEFLDHASDIIVGSNEDFGFEDQGEGKPRRLLAHLSPRSKLEVSWAGGEGPTVERAPLLTAQGEIAVDIDVDQMRTRSSWMIRCVRGLTRRLEFRVNDEDELTELLVNDESNRR